MAKRIVFNEEARKALLNARQVNIKQKQIILLFLVLLQCFQIPIDCCDHMLVFF